METKKRRSRWGEKKENEQKEDAVAQAVKAALAVQQQLAMQGVIGASSAIAKQVLSRAISLFNKFLFVLFSFLKWCCTFHLFLSLDSRKSPKRNSKLTIASIEFI